MEEQLTFREYGVQVIRERLIKMLAHMRGVRRGEDIEAVHDMRVASRRLRAALNVFKSVFVSQEFLRFEREIKAITDALANARDLDVMILTLEEMKQSLPKMQQGGVDSFIDIKKDERMKCQRDVIRAFDHLENRDLVGWFEEIARGDHANSFVSELSGDSHTREESGGEPC